ATNARLILGINLEADSTRLAATEARTIVDGLAPGAVEALELGNEPELYGSFGWYRTADGVEVPGRPRDYDFQKFTNEFSRFGAAVRPGSATGSPPRFGRSTPCSRWPATGSMASTSTRSREPPTASSSSAASAVSGEGSCGRSTTGC